MEWVSIGYLASSHGIRGQAKVKGYGSSWNHLLLPINVRLLKDNSSKNITISRIAIKPDYILIDTPEVQNPEYWTDWRGASIQVPREILDGIDLKGDEEYFFYQLVSLKVQDEMGNLTGFIVQNIEENPAHAILVLEGNGRKISIPFVKEWVGKIDVKSGYLVVKNWEMWLEV